jgi:hypothetical protein
MGTRRFLFIMSLTFAVAVVYWGVGRGNAQTQNAPDTTIVDAGGRAHKVMPMRQMTQDQRKAAADRAKATRAAKTGHKKPKTTVPQGEVTQ